MAVPVAMPSSRCRIAVLTRCWHLSATFRLSGHLPRERVLWYVMDEPCLPLRDGGVFVADDDFKTVER